MKRAKPSRDDMLRCLFVRLPLLLYQQVTATAAGEGITVDQYITNVLARDLGVTDEELNLGRKKRRRG